jgi:hypothetical protein
MQQMSRRDAELFYDGPIPAGVINDALPDRLAVTTPVRIGAVTEKPASIVARMATCIATLATDRGVVETRDLKRLGFSEEQIDRHGQAAIAQAMHANPMLMAQALRGDHG